MIKQFLSCINVFPPLCTDGNGFLTLSELMHSYSILGDDLYDETEYFQKIQKVMTVADSDLDGQIDPDEAKDYTAKVLYDQARLDAFANYEGSTEDIFESTTSKFLNSNFRTQTIGVDSTVVY